MNNTMMQNIYGDQEFIEEQFNIWTDGFEKDNITLKKFQKPIYEILAKINFDPRWSILDVGCLYGMNVEIFKEYCGSDTLKYEGVDLSQPAITKAQALYPEYTFAITDGTKLEHYLKGRKVDFILASGYLNCIQDWKQAIQTLCSCAKEYVYLNRVYVSFLNAFSEQRTVLGRSDWFHVYSMQDFFTVLNDRNIEAVQFICYEGLPPKTPLEKAKMCFSVLLRV